MRSFLVRTSIFVAALAVGACSGSSGGGGGNKGGEGGDDNGGSGGSSAGGKGGSSAGGKGGSSAGGSGGSSAGGSGGSSAGGKGGSSAGGAGGKNQGGGGGADDTDGGANDVDGAAGGKGGSKDGSTNVADGGRPTIACEWKDDKSFCECAKWNCGGTTITDNKGTTHTVYCGGCTGGQFCQTEDPLSAGTCGGSNPLMYQWQKQKIDILVQMGENDKVTSAYDYAENINDMRGYTVGKVGFCTGTGDYITVAQCYNDLKPGNVLSKYMGHRDAMGKALDGLLYYSDQYWLTMMNQGDTKLIDSLAAGSTFIKDCATAAKDAEYKKCQDDMAEVLYMATAIKHAAERGLHGALTLGFIYDTELNFGDGDDPDGTLGAISTMALADKDYGPTMPKDFTGKPWEESKWLGYLIKERTIVMSKNKDWREAMEQDATWEAARRLHTGKSPQDATDLSMDYDITSAYKAGTKSAGVTPCWPTELANNTDAQTGIWTVTTDKSASATDQTKWKSVGAAGKGSFMNCPPNPTP